MFDRPNYHDVLGGAAGIALAFLIRLLVDPALFDSPEETWQGKVLYSRVPVTWEEVALLPAGNFRGPAWKGKVVVSHGWNRGPVGLPALPDDGCHVIIGSMYLYGDPEMIQEMVDALRAEGWRW